MILCENILIFTFLGEYTVDKELNIIKNYYNGYNYVYDIINPTLLNTPWSILNHIKN
jgi:hypothetical protein